MLDKMGYTEEAAERKQRFEATAGKNYKEELLGLLRKKIRHHSQHGLQQHTI